MSTSRVEAFSDGVLAIIITIMVLELKAPEGDTLADLWDATGVGFLSYLVSFVYVGIYWNNHHHMLKLSTDVSGGILWANLHLLFWLSLVPFMTRWMDESGFATVPVFSYGVNLLLTAMAYTVLQRALVRRQGKDGPLATALGTSLKERISPFIYLAGCASTFFSPLLGLVAYAAVAAIWLVPDRRLERALLDTTGPASSDP